MRHDRGQNKIVIYTAIFGGKDVLLEPKCTPRNCDFVCFSDTDFESKVWQVNKVKATNTDPVRAAKIYKILPHKYFPQYEYSIWVDGNILVKRNPVRLIRKYLKTCNMAAYNHVKDDDSRDCVYDEYEALLVLNKKGMYKDDPDIMKRQIACYKEQNYPAHNGLITAKVLVRRHNEKDVVDTMKDWWREIESGSRRDQLSFNYVAWKNKFKFKYINGNSRRNWYFRHFYHTKRSDSK